MRGQGIGLAVIGCGTVGRIRAVLAREHPAVEWIGLCDIDADTAKALGEDVEADFVTSDLDELLTRPEVTAVIVATAENEHVAPILAAVQLGKPLFSVRGYDVSGALSNRTRSNYVGFSVIDKRARQVWTDGDLATVQKYMEETFDKGNVFITSWDEKLTRFIIYVGGPDQAGAFSRSVPSQGLAEIGRNKGSDDAQYGGQYES